MRIRKFIFLVSIIVMIFTLVLPVHAEAEVEDPTNDPSWRKLRQGIFYKKFDLSSPRLVDVFVSAMDRSDMSATIDTGIADGVITGGTATVKEMFFDYDEVINYWGSTWGNRNDVAVAINGYFFGGSLEPPGVPWSGQIHSGWYAKRFTNYDGDDQSLSYDVGFGWTMDRIAFVGSCVEHKPDKQRIYYIRIDKDQKFYGINRTRSSEDIVIYSPQFGIDTDTDNTGLEVLVELSRPLLIMPNTAFPVKGFIREIRNKQGSTKIPFDHIVISATGEKANIMLGNIKVGDEIGINQELTPCGGSTVDYTKTYASMGGDFHFLNNGVVRDYAEDPDAVVPDARTAVVFDENWVYFLVIDGRNPGTSEGLSIKELADFAKNRLGATWGVTLDSGGSSTMVVDGVIVNNTYCNYNDCRSQYEEDDISSSINSEWATREHDSLIGHRKDHERLVSLQSDTISINSLNLVTTDIKEPRVANSFMMVSVVPIEKSTAFSEHELVTSEIPSAIRLGPGGNYPQLGYSSAGQQGSIVEHGNGMNGVLATGSYWWKSDFGDLVGWIRQIDLTFTPTDWQYLPMISNQK